MKNKHFNDPTQASLFQRIVRLTLIAVCLISLAWLGVNSSFEGHRLLYQQAYSAASSLTRQLALSAREPLEKSDKPALTRLANQLESDPYVLSVAVFDDKGQLVTHSENWQPYHKENTITEATPGISKLKLPLIEPVLDAELKPIGFVRITYLPRAAMQNSLAYFHDVGRQVLLMLLITIILTWQLGRGLKRWQLRRYLQKTAPPEHSGE